MGLFDDDTEDDQRFRNLILYKFYGTDKEMDEAAPGFLIIFGIIVVIIVGVLIFG